VQSLVMGLPLDLELRTKSQLAIDILAETLTGRVVLDFVCGDGPTAPAPNCASSAKSAGQATCCRFPPASASPRSTATGCRD
jgi:hypothetical protein